MYLRVQPAFFSTHFRSIKKKIFKILMQQKWVYRSRLKILISMTLVIFLKFHYFSRPGKCIFKFHDFSWPYEPCLQHTPNSKRLERAWSRGIVDRTKEYSFVLSTMPRLHARSGLLGLDVWWKQEQFKNNRGSNSAKKQPKQTNKTKNLTSSSAKIYWFLKKACIYLWCWKVLFYDFF